MTMVTFMGIDCVVDKRVYPRNKKQAALQLYAADTAGNQKLGISQGEPVVTASVCLPGYPFNKDETVIKDYSENEGILDVLVQAKIVEITGKTVNSGFCTLPVVKMVN